MLFKSKEEVNNTAVEYLLSLSEDELASLCYDSDFNKTENNRYFKGVMAYLKSLIPDGGRVRSYNYGEGKSNVRILMEKTCIQPSFNIYADDME
jgi:hypothetical protein